MSSASAATLTAVAVLENGRKLSGKKILFDAHLYLSQNHDPVLALLHYFNDGDLTFTNLGHYVIEANVTRMQEDVNVKSETSLDAKAYQLIGDINWVIVPTSARGIDPRFPTRLTISGVVFNSNTENKIFELDCHPYVSLLKSQRNGTDQSTAPFPVKCTFPNTKRFTKPPVPKDGTYVTARCILTGFVLPPLESGESSEDPPLRLPIYFDAQIDDITFLGRTTVQPPPTIPSPEKGKTPVKKGLSFTGYHDIDLDGGESDDAPSASGSTKRKRISTGN